MASTGLASRSPEEDAMDSMGLLCERALDLGGCRFAAGPDSATSNLGRASHLTSELTPSYAAGPILYSRWLDGFYKLLFCQVPGRVWSKWGKWGWMKDSCDYYGSCLWS